MKKIIFSILVCSSYCCVAQNQLDNYFVGTNTFTVVGNSTHGLSSPHDLDFVPSRPSEWWVLNKESNGGSVVIFYDAGKPTQTRQFRRDSHNSHFMARSVAIAFGDNNSFASAQEIKNTAAASSTFMGPALWPSDTAIFARQNQNNWVTGELLGSHIDMLHQSPFGMGVAHDTDNIYWYFDGQNGNICKYDFGPPHGVGEDDHSDGKIHRYTDVTVVRKANVPSHLALDKVNDWLYIVDGGNNRIMRLKTTSGNVVGNLTVPTTAGEPLAEYKNVTGATKEVLITTGLTAPCGIDYKNGRIVVSDTFDGKIHIYDVTTATPTLVGSISTGSTGVMGVRIDANNKIWYVNKTTKQLIRIDNVNVTTSVEDVAQKMNYSIHPNPASNVLNVNLEEFTGNETARIRIIDVVGKEVYSIVTKDKLTTINTSMWAKGLYTVVINYKEANAASKVIVQ